MKKTTKVEILRVTNSQIVDDLDEVILENPYKLFVNGEYITTFFCSPENLEYLAAGFLYTQKIIRCKNDLKNISIDHKTINVYLKSSISFLTERNATSQKSFKEMVLHDMKPIREEITQNISLSVVKIQKVMREFVISSKTFANTGAAHSVALMKNYKIVHFIEDVARHNAVDKIIGKALIEEIDLSQFSLLASCRLSVEIVSKAAIAQIPVLISRAATSSLAIELAKDLNITLIGFSRGDKFNVYSDTIELLSE